MGSSIVAPAEDAGIGNIVRQEFAEPVDAIASGPCLLAVAVEAMDGDDARRGGAKLAGRARPLKSVNSLNHGVGALCDNL